MIYFKNQNTLEVFAYDSVEDRNVYGSNDLVEMSEEEVYAHLNPPEPIPTIDSVKARRLAAYRAESDQLKLQADFDALQAGTQPDYSLWIAKVEEIKQRYPLPSA